MCIMEIVFQYDSRFIGNTRYSIDSKGGGNQSNHMRKVNHGNKYGYTANVIKYGCFKHGC